MTVYKQIEGKVLRSKDGALFFTSSFPGYDEEYVGQVLSDLCRKDILVRILCRKDILVRIAFGIYLKPVRSRFGIVYPQPSEIVAAIARRDKARILPSGNTAAYHLGLTTQVPMRSEYITTGSARVIKIGNRSIALKRSVPRNFAYKDPLLPVLVQALKAIKEENLTEEHLGIIRRLLEDHPQQDTWQHDIRLAPVWIRKLLTYIKTSIDHDQMDRQ